MVKFAKAIPMGAIIAAPLAMAETVEMPAGYDPINVTFPNEGSVSEDMGLAAFDRIYEVATSPRCANCHVGDDNIPMWSGKSYGEKPRPHGMNIHADESRIGAETMLCSTCHMTTTDLESEGHNPPHFGIPWQLAPVEFEWFGKSAQDICLQLKTEETNGGRDWKDLVDHLTHDASLSGPVLWSWNPGGDREVPPYTLQDHVNDMIIWGAAGQPCPEGELGATTNTTTEG